MAEPIKRRPLNEHERIALDMERRGNALGNSMAFQGFKATGAHRKLTDSHFNRGMNLRQSLSNSTNKNLTGHYRLQNSMQQRGWNLVSSMQDQASRVFNPNEKFFNVDNIYSKSDLNTARLIRPSKPSFFFPKKRIRSAEERRLDRKIKELKRLSKK